MVSERQQPSQQRALDGCYGFPHLQPLVQLLPLPHQRTAVPAVVRGGGLRAVPQPRPGGRRGVHGDELGGKRREPRRAAPQNRF